MNRSSARIFDFQSLAAAAVGFYYGQGNTITIEDPPRKPPLWNSGLRYRRKFTVGTENVPLP
jgi:hypothetical protein